MHLLFKDSKRIFKGGLKMTYLVVTMIALAMIAISGVMAWFEMKAH